ATNQKLQPLIGVWNAADQLGTLPTVASTSVAMNSLAVGTTQVHMAAATAGSTLRIAVADQFGGGRPDFNYKARILYMDSVAPTTVGTGGGLITITGTGFKQGNQVLVNGVRATVTSCSATQIVAIAPSAAAAKATAGVPLDLEVLDTRTGGTTVLPSVISYAAAVDLVREVSAPAALETGLAATTLFAVQVLTSDGVAPAVGASVRMSVSSGSAILGCGASSCVVVTDASGQAKTTVTGGAAGSITLLATELSGGNFVQVTVVDSDPIRAAAIANPSAYLAAGASAAWKVPLLATMDGFTAPGVPVVWTTTSSLSLTPSQNSTGSDGSALVTVSASNVSGPTTNVVTGCVWTSVCAMWMVYGVDATQWTVAVASGANQSVTALVSLSPVSLLVTDRAGHALAGASVTIYQAVHAWEGACPSRGRCPAAPILARSEAAAISDANGVVVITPQQISGTPQVVTIAASTGTQGFTALSLLKTQ
ncbi:MAG: IPT/TIG domain-containing protein, partial [Acidobacteriota bacterium]